MDIMVGKKKHLRFIEHQVSRIHRQKDGSIEAAGWRWHSRPDQNPPCHHQVRATQQRKRGWDS